MAIRYIVRLADDLLNRYFTFVQAFAQVFHNGNAEHVIAVDSCNVTDDSDYTLGKAIVEYLGKYSGKARYGSTVCQRVLHCSESPLHA